MTAALVLASASPRRQHLLEAAGIVLELAPAGVDESYYPGESPAAHVRRLARAKAAVAARWVPATRVVLGADTVVVMDGRVYGKPADAAEAREFLAAFSGRAHDVLTGVCLLRRASRQECVWVARSTVHFRKLTSGDIDAYFHLVYPLDKAGAYGIQEHGEKIIERVEGLRSTVIGLPVEEVLDKLRHEFT